MSGCGVSMHIQCYEMLASLYFTLTLPYEWLSLLSVVTVTLPYEWLSLLSVVAVTFPDKWLSLLSVVVLFIGTFLIYTMLLFVLSTLPAFFYPQ